MRRVMRFFGALFVKVTMQVTACGMEHIPRSGPALMLINHVSYLDPVVAVLFSSVRDVTPISKYELYESPWTHWMIVNWGAIPVKRFEFDRTALKLALNALKSMDMVLVAPEGHRNPALMNPKEGIVYLAHKSGAAMLPTGVSGTHQFGKHIKRLRRTPVTVNYGRAVRLRQSRWPVCRPAAGRRRNWCRN